MHRRTLLALLPIAAACADNARPETAPRVPPYVPPSVPVSAKCAFFVVGGDDIVGSTSWSPRRDDL